MPHTPRNMIQRFILAAGANLAGFLWNSGNGVQFLLGAVTLSPRVIASSLLNVASSSSTMIFGHKDKGVFFGSLFGMAGTGVFLFPDLATGNATVIGGYLLFCLASSFGVFSGPLSARFCTSPATILRTTLARPRRLMGLILLASRLPILADSFAKQDWTTFLPFAIWAAGDLSFSFSGEEATKQQR